MTYAGARPAAASAACEGTKSPFRNAHGSIIVISTRAGKRRRRGRGPRYAETPGHRRRASDPRPPRPGVQGRRPADDLRRGDEDVNLVEARPRATKLAIVSPPPSTSRFVQRRRPSSARIASMLSCSAPAIATISTPASRSRSQRAGSAAKPTEHARPSACPAPVRTSCDVAGNRAWRSSTTRHCGRGPAGRAVSSGSSASAVADADEDAIHPAAQLDGRRGATSSRRSTSTRRSTSRSCRRASSPICREHADGRVAAASGRARSAGVPRRPPNPKSIGSPASRRIRAP